jgi:hypothetical protein
MQIQNPEAATQGTVVVLEAQIEVGIQFCQQYNTNGGVNAVDH